MSNSALDQVSDSLDDYLVSLAEGLADAQLRLDEAARISGPQGIRYQIPKLEFDLKIDFTMERSSEGEGDALAESPVFNKRFMVRSMSPAAQAQGNTTTNENVVSSLTGSFVAVPTQQSTPPVVVETLLVREPDGNVAIQVQVDNINGEPAVDVEVEINIDRQKSNSQNQALGLPDLKPNTQVAQALVETNEAGLAESTLLIDANEPDGSNIVLVIDCQYQTETINYRVTGAV